MPDFIVTLVKKMLIPHVRNSTFFLTSKARLNEVVGQASNSNILIQTLTLQTNTK